jgi:hypothetical protein
MGSTARVPGAAVYKDHRVMLEKRKDMDAVLIWNSGRAQAGWHRGGAAGRAKGPGGGGVA